MIRERVKPSDPSAKPKNRQQAAAHRLNVQTATDTLANPELVSLIELAWVLGGKATSEYDRTEANCRCGT
ncbi:hypothetical protein O9992_28535 [Vibrio lentus]|nr:hypothetical protein [Vibrio lentus]